MDGPSSKLYGSSLVSENGRAQVQISIIDSASAVNRIREDHLELAMVGQVSRPDPRRPLTHQQSGFMASWNALGTSLEADQTSQEATCSSRKPSRHPGSRPDTTRMI